MHDIPMFTTQNGVAFLVLQEIPNNGVAYICINDSHNPEMFLQECCDFCRAVGAELVYADGISATGNYPHYTDVIEMRQLLCDIPETTAKLIPVDEDSLEKWRQLYNENMQSVPAAFYMSIGRAEEILKMGTGYFVFRDDELLGIGVAGGDRIDSVVSLTPGAGKDVLCALCSVLTDEEVILEVASQNNRAVAFYKKMNFVTTKTKYRWYKIFPY